jgi:hypothetical protein
MKTLTNRAFVNPFVMGTLLVVCGSGAAGLGSVWMRHQISVTANENRVLENRIVEVGRLSQQMTAWVAEEQDITALLKKNNEWHLGLVPPQEGQVQIIAQDSVARLTAKRDQGILTDRGISSSVHTAISFNIPSQH